MYAHSIYTFIFFTLIIFIRRLLYRYHIKKTIHFPVPIVVVGNITMGGTGKTPLVIYLAHYLKQHGFVPGIVSRGVGGIQEGEPVWVDAESDPLIVGDEALLLATQSGCPLVICRDRVAAVRSSNAPRRAVTRAVPASPRAPRAGEASADTRPPRSRRRSAAGRARSSRASPGRGSPSSGRRRRAR